MRFETTAIHAGDRLDATTGATSVPNKPASLIGYLNTRKRSKR